MTSTVPPIPVGADEDLLCCLGPAFPDLEHTDPARISRIAAEIADGFTHLRGLTRAVSIFGSARLPAQHPDCQLAQQTAAALGRAEYGADRGVPHALHPASGRARRRPSRRRAGADRRDAPVGIEPVKGNR